MIKTYKINDTTFQTITLPKGTVLFRGLHIGNDNSYKKIFTDLIGYPDDKYYCISSSMNVFFYPVPYVSDTVNIYNVHVIYLTQYDIELLLLIKPSTISRYDKINDNYNNIMKVCSNISEKNTCGVQMSDNDPCLTNTILKRYPHIRGYIAIADQDASIFTAKYHHMIRKDDITKVKHIIPSIVSNNRKIIGIPEIVMNPLHLSYSSYNSDKYPIKARFDGLDSIVKYCIMNRSQYNYFPLLYFTNNNIYQFHDLVNTDIIQKIKIVHVIIVTPIIVLIISMKL